MTAPMNWTQLFNNKRFKAYNGEWVAMAMLWDRKDAAALRTDCHMDVWRFYCRSVLIFAVRISVVVRRLLCILSGIVLTAVCAYLGLVMGGLG